MELTVENLIAHSASKLHVDIYSYDNVKLWSGSVQEFKNNKDSSLCQKLVCIFGIYDNSLLILLEEEK